MTTAILSSEGQLTLPVEIRHQLGLEHGGPVELVELGAGMVGIVAAPLDVRSLKGIISKPAQPVTLEAMERAIRQRGAGL
jgi:bifunctional DNA-binding transcriptional regulator/antitoxin component of YhaV-PrlF toxin-antitoxin module